MAELEKRLFVTRASKTLEFTSLGFGAAPLGNMHRALDENEAEQTVLAAWESGVRYFDTAPLYGHGLSETRIGRALKTHARSDYLLSTKVGRMLDPCAPGDEDSGIYKSTPNLRVRFDYSYDGIMRSYEESLARLGLDRVDILFVHDVDARTHGGRTGSEARIRELIERGGWRALQELRASAGVSAIGIGVNEWEPCARILEIADPDLFLLAGRYTLLEQGPLETLFPQCLSKGTGIVIGGPFNSGILARGARDGAMYDYAPAPEAILDRVRSLETACRFHDVPLAAAALQFPLANPIVVSLIAGAQTRQEAAQNAALLDFNIPATLWDDLKARRLLAAGAPTPNGKKTC
jgi:D-threo-aldose 1-dehydrogenase